jgi:hypothetical protein
MQKNFCVSCRSGGGAWHVSAGALLRMLTALFAAICAGGSFGQATFALSISLAA